MRLLPRVIRLLAAGTLWFFVLANCLAEAAQPTLVESSGLKLEYQDGRLSISASGSSVPFIASATLLQEGGAASAINLTNETFGEGRAIEILNPDGSRVRVAVYPGLPFALVHSSLHNGGSKAVIMDKLTLLAGELNIGAEVKEIKSFGTAGLLSMDNNPGSYAWLAAVHPKSRKGVVVGWLTHDRGSGVVFTRSTNGTAIVEAVAEYGRLAIQPGEHTQLETLAIGWFDDARVGLEGWANAVGRVYKVKLKPQPTGYCTWYSRPYGGAADETHLGELAAFSATNLAPFGFSVVQIDDGWQSGFKRSNPSSPKKDFRTHNPSGPYPSGMKSIADYIRSLKLTPGIWFMPFAGTTGDPFYDQRLDWFAKTKDGEPYDTPWGGTCLDMTHPGAREHVSSTVRRICREWGYDYIKIDGLWTGTATKQLYVNSGYKPDDLGEALFHNPKSTAIEAFREGLRLVRQAAGSNVFILGCNAPQNMRSYGGSFGLVDAMRIGPDNKAEWKSLLRGPTFGSRHYFLHRRIWHNDPDPVYVRESMPLPHARLICSWVAISGQLCLSSEWLPGLTAERLDILKRTMPAHQELARPVDLFDRDLPEVWLVSARGRTVVGLFNWNSKEKEFSLPLETLGLERNKEYAGFDYWADSLISDVRDRLKLVVPAESCVMVGMQPKTNHPQVLSSSRHVLHGLIDISHEHWDEDSGTLSGCIELVANFPTELRILGAGPAARFEIGEEDKGLTTSMRHDGTLTRVRIKSQVSRKLNWKVKLHAP